MWKAAAFAGGAWREISVVALEGVPFSSTSVLQLSRTSPGIGNTRLVRYLAQEVEVPNASRDAIELWASKAAAESNEFEWDSAYKVAAVEEAVALYAQAPSADAHAATLAWHDRTAVIVPFPGNDERVVVEYTPSIRDELRIERLKHRYASADHVLETVLDWRGYFGSESAIIDHWTTMRRTGRTFVASLIGTGGFAVGSVVRRLTRPQPTFERDPTRHNRLVTMLEGHRHIEAQCPDLAAVPRTAHARAAVFVHGTVSCGVQALKDLLPPPGNQWGPIYRYEHDTFRPIEENAVELANLIRDRLDTPHLLIAAHSRGGLVARTAAARLANQYPGGVELCTFGTPHLGTPLAAIGGRLLNLLFKLGEDVVGAIPAISPLSRAYGYLVDSPILPAGIEAMREDSPGIGTLNAIGDRYPVRSWGSSFNIEHAPSGFGVAIEGALAGALSDRLHDLVVPTASALAVGAAQPVLNCSHVHYFTQPLVQAAFAAFFAQPPGSVVAPAGSPPAGITVAADHVIIGGIQVRKRQNPAAGIPVMKPLEVTSPGRGAKRKP
jgi:hypothetical protein